MFSCPCWRPIDKIHLTVCCRRFYFQDHKNRRVRRRHCTLQSFGLFSDIDGKREKEEMLATLTGSSIRFVRYRLLSPAPASTPAASAAPSPLPCVLTNFGIFSFRPTMDSNSSSSSSSFSTFSYSSPSGGRRGRGSEMKDYSREMLKGRGGGGSYGGRGGGKDKIDALGRLLSRILRHMASELNLNMRSDGFVKVEDLLKLNIKTFANIPLMLHTVDDIKEAVKKDNKQRFSLVEENGELWIRANQGHSITTVEAEHLLKPILSAEEVPICVHGTYKKYLPSILEQGLKRMKRLHVHFSCGLPMDGEVISGMRRDVNVLIFLDVARALEEGMKLYISDNKVILTDGFDGVIPVKYFQRIESWPDRRPISF